MMCHGTEYNGLSYIAGYEPLTAIELMCQEGNIIELTTQAELDVTELTCTGRQEPVIRIDETTKCANESINGRSLALENQLLIKVGWMIDGKFREQYRSCMDTKIAASLWTHHNVTGSCIDLRFKDSNKRRPGFRRDVRGFPYHRFFKQFSTDGDLAE